MMKRILIALLVVAMFMMSGAAMAAEYSTCQDFLDWMDENGIAYDYKGLDDGDNDVVFVDNTTDVCSYTIRYYFHPDLDLVSLRVYYFAEYDESSFVDMVKACNDVNYTYKYICMYCDTTDNTVTASMDLIVRENLEVGDIVGEATQAIAFLLDEAYPMIAPYAK